MLSVIKQSISSMSSYIKNQFQSCHVIGYKIINLSHVIIHETINFNHVIIHETINFSHVMFLSVVRAETLRFKEEGVRDILKDVFLPWYNAFRFLMQVRLISICEFFDLYRVYFYYTLHCRHLRFLV